MTTDEMMKQITLDVEKVRQDMPKIDGWAVSLAAYSDVICELVRIVPNVRLTNDGEYGYVRGARKGGFVTASDITMKHVLMIPYLPGGYLRFGYIAMPHGSKLDFLELSGREFVEGDRRALHVDDVDDAEVKRALAVLAKFADGRFTAALRTHSPIS